MVAPEPDLRVDVDAMLAAVTPKTRIVFLANPNNPTGTYLSMEEVRRLHAGLPRNVLLVIDAAYAEYVRRNDYEAGIEMVSQFDNVVMTRTFSKAFALAGLRRGLGVLPRRRRRCAEPRARAVQCFGAGAGRGRGGPQGPPPSRSRRSRTMTHWRQWLTDQIRKTGLKVDDSVGNFVLIQFPATKGLTAKDADAFLSARGLILSARRRLRFAQCASPDGGHRRRQQGGGGGAGGVHGVTHERRTPVRQDRADRHRPDRLFHRPCRKAGESGRPHCRAHPPCRNACTRARRSDFADSLARHGRRPR